MISGRKEEVETVRRWLEDEPDLLEIQAESVDEAVAFLAVVTNRVAENEKIPLAFRGIVLKEAETWRSLGGRKSGQLVVLRGDASDIAFEIQRSGNHVALARPKGGIEKHNTVPLPRLSRQELTGALSQMGLDESRSWRLLDETMRSLSVLRRVLGKVDRPPEWARPDRAPDLLPALMAGAWNDKHSADREILAALAQRPYEELKNRLQSFVGVEDPPLMRVGTVWKLTAPTDGWLRLGRYLTEDDFDRLREAVEEVLGEEDPRFELPPGERWTAELQGKALAHSGWLREGLAQTLVLLAVHGEQARVCLRMSPEEIAKIVVYKLLYGASEDRWGALADLLPILAEAAPDEFLRAVEDSLEVSPPPVMSLFGDMEPFFDSSAHTNLLWALEALAWSPAYLGRASLVLGRLAVLDPGGTISNRPANSLRDVLLPWRRHTSASVEQRLTAIDLLVRSESQAGWELLLELLPQDHSMTLGTSTLRWRDWDAGASEPITKEEYKQYVGAIGHRILEAAQRHGGWEHVVQRLTAFDLESRRRIRDELQKISKRPDDKESRGQLCDALRQIVTEHRQNPEADGVLPVAEIDELETLLRSLEAGDPVHRFSWLFDSSFPEIPLPEQPNYEVLDREIMERRDQAVEAILETEDVEALLAFAQKVQFPGLVGASAARIVAAEKIEDILLRRTLGSEDRALRHCGVAFVEQRSALAGEDWIDSRLTRAQQEGWPQAALVDLCCGFPLETETWDKIRELGEELERAYWGKVQLQGLANPSEKEIAIAQLLSADRAADAVVLARHRETEALSSELLAQTLEELARCRTVDDQRQLPTPQQIGSLFEALENQRDLDSSRLARLEWLYLEILEGSRCPPRTLYRHLARDPALFAELVSLVFLPKGQDSPEGEDRPVDERNADRVVKGYRLLQSWNAIPGTRDDGSIDEEALWQWVQEARAKCTDLDRREAGERMIGVMLATAPVGGDGIWPSEEVRSIIEEAWSRNLESGISMGVGNRRGFVTVVTAGAEERKLENQYRQDAEALASSWPHTSAMLQAMADSYKSLAYQLERRAEEDELRP